MGNNLIVVSCLYFCITAAQCHLSFFGPFFAYEHTAQISVMYLLK